VRKKKRRRGGRRREEEEEEESGHDPPLYFRASFATDLSCSMPAVSAHIHMMILPNPLMLMQLIIAYGIKAYRR